MRLLSLGFLGALLFNLMIGYGVIHLFVSGAKVASKTCNKKLTIEKYIGESNLFCPVKGE